MPNPTPAADGRVARFRLPVEPPTRNLLIASLASIAGACQLFAWALARLPTFFVVLGVSLILVGIGFALASLVRHYRLRWVVYVSAESIAVVNGRRRTELPWRQIRGVRYDAFRLQIIKVDGRPWRTLPVDRTRPADQAAQVVLRAIEAERAAHP